MKIKITCKGADTVSYKKIQPFQGDLKEMTEEDAARLDNEILTNGFNSPVHVWKNGRKLYNLDGHQRLIRVAALEEQGYEIPPIPIDYIKADNEKHAKEILLSRVKQYGQVQQTGLHQYLTDADLSIDHVKESFGDLPGVNMEKFDKEFFHPPEEKNPVGATEISAESYSNMVHKCPKCGFEFGKGAHKEKNK